MPAAKLPLLKGRRLLAWETVRDKLQRDPDLKRLSINWILPESPDFDNPAATDKISIRLEPKCGTVERICFTGWGGTDSIKPLSITYEIFAPEGPEEVWENVARVNDAIEHCLNGRFVANRVAQPSEFQAHWRELQEGGVDDLDIITSADWGQPGMIEITVYEST